MRDDWSTLKKLIWLFILQGGGPSHTTLTVTGVSPLALANAIAHSMVSLTQYGKCEQPAVDYLATVTQEGKCEQASTPTPTAPMDIWCNNGRIAYGQYGKNLFDRATVGVEQGTIGNITGSESDSNYRVRTGFMKVTPNTTYTASAVISGFTSSSPNGLHVFEFSSAEQSGFIQASGWQNPSGYTFTTGANTNYIRFVFAISSTTAITPSAVSNIQVELGSFATAYEPYHFGLHTVGTPEVLSVGGQLRSVPNLLGVGDCKDTYELISGLDTHNVGVKVLTGDENYEKLSGANYVSLAKTNIPNILSTTDATCLTTAFPQVQHSKISQNTDCFTVGASYVNFKLDGDPSVNAFKAWLAEQYRNGTPVIIVYPLATATTETVTAEPIDRTYPQEITATAEVTNITITETHADVSVPSTYTALPIWCNNGRVVAGNCISNIPDGQGTFITPSGSTKNRIYKAFPTNLVVGRSYTVTVTGTGWDIIVQKKNPDGTGGSNVSEWVTTYAFTPEEGYIYGVAMRKAPNAITPADFNGTLTLDTTDGKPWAVGTPEVLTICGKNLFDPSAVTEGKAINASGVDVDSTVSQISAYIPFNAGDNIAVSWIKGYNASETVRLHAYDGAKNWLSQIVSKTNNTAATGGENSMTGTAPNGCAYVRLSIPIADTNIQLELGSTATDYEAYTGQTATVETLYGVGDYKDTHELIHGVKTGAVGAMWIDGTEGDWVKATSGSNVMFYRDSNLPAAANVSASGGIIECEIATHYKNSWTSGSDKIVQRSNKNFGFMNPTGFTVDSTVEEWENFCKAHPFLVFYPLATETTETVTAQPLNTAQGTNVVDVVSNVDPVTLRVEYMGVESA